MVHLAMSDGQIVKKDSKYKAIRRCTYQYPDGKRCTNNSVHGTNLCYRHGGVLLMPKYVASIEDRQRSIETIRYKLSDKEVQARVREIMSAGAPDDVREELAFLRARAERLMQEEGIESDRAAKAVEKTADLAIRYGEYEIKASKFITKAMVIAIINQLLSLTEEVIYAEASSGSEADRILTRLREAISSTFSSYAASADGEGSTQ